MTQLYLWFNAVIYVIFAVWCTASHAQTSQAAGFLSLDASGRSEYLVVYGGMELGIAAFYAYLALNPELYRAGLVFSVCIYLGIVLYRISTVSLFWPVNRLTLMVAGLEIFLLAAALLLLLQRPRS